MAFNEFFAINGGSNLNAGADHTGLEPGTTALYTATNGGWNGTTTYTPTDGSTPASTVTVGDFASVYVDGATVAVYIARVTTVNAGVNGTIVLSSTIRFGTPPSSLGTTRSVKVGGAWQGFNGTSIFPLTLATPSGLTISNVRPRFNLKNNQTYTMTAGITVAVGETAILVQGYSSTPGDLGKSTIDFGATTGNLWTNSAGKIGYTDIIWSTSAASATGSLFAAGSSSGVVLHRCVAHGAQGAGFNFGSSGGYSMAIECEAYDCNKSNTGSLGGFTVTNSVAPVSLTRCYSHNHAAGANADGFFSQGMTILSNCIADTCAGRGFNMSISSTNTVGVLEMCDAYNNTGDGITWSGNDTPFIENCNLIKNGGWGINVSGAVGVVFFGYVKNCGFGAGTQANSSGTINVVGSIIETGHLDYASNVTPWVAPATGDFRISLPAAVSVGAGSFTQTGNSKTGAVGFPDIGAAQSLHFVAVSSTSTAYVS